MAVVVRYFAALREQVGRAQQTVAVAPGETAQALYERLVPDQGEGRLPVLFAVHHRYAAPDAALADGDEVAFLPPLGGG